MRLISFDVGIKNMAYCIFIKTENNIIIQDWNVLNLMEAELPTQICTCIITTKQTKNKPSVSTNCAKIAKYQKNGTFFCEKHAKTSSLYLMPTKQRTFTQLKKLKAPDLLKLGQSHLLFIENSNPEKLLKRELLETIGSFFEKQCFEPIIPKKSKTAGDTDLIQIGKNMKELLNQITEIENITHVIIENQISPIATRMKTVQGMLAQYFIMKNTNINIDFISSANKLKQFSTISVEPVLKNTIILEKNNDNREPEPKIKDGQKDGKTNDKTQDKTLYKQHKLDGIFYCSQILDKNPELGNWKSSLDTKKKDDFADSFLQGLWYFKSKNIISYAEDLKIKHI
jgi:hypothetical protein